MDLAGIGVDIVEIDRIERILERTPSFARRVFTEEEISYCERTRRPAEHYAGRFAAREAVLKALGTGFSGGIGLKDVWVTRDASGAPQAVLEGRAKEVAEERGVREIALSLSSTRDVVVANAVAVTDAVRPKDDRRPDPREELRKSFKEARSIIDELEREDVDAILAARRDNQRDSQTTGDEGHDAPVGQIEE
jgi:holo-[acyl-carrier protein] synthase